MDVPVNTAELYRDLSNLNAWEPAYDTNGHPREGADVAELTGVLDLEDWPAGMRVIVRRERPHPGAQLRFDDVDGYRLTAFVTNTTGRQLADLEVRHRSRARREDRIRIAKDSGLRNFPLKGFDQIPAERFRSEPDLVGCCRFGRRDRVLERSVGVSDSRDASVGAETIADARVLGARDNRENGPEDDRACEEHGTLGGCHRSRTHTVAKLAWSRAWIEVWCPCSLELRKPLGSESTPNCGVTRSRVMSECQNQCVTRAR